MQAAGYGTDTQSVNAQNQAITAAWLELSAEREWSFLRVRDTAGAMTIGSEVVPLPTNLAVPKHVRLSTASASYELDEIPAAEMQRRLDGDVPATSGVPAYWAWVRNTILVWPKPDAAYAVAVDYVKFPDPGDFDADNDATPFTDERFPHVIAWGAIRWLAFRNRDQISYNIANSEWAQAKAQFEQADRRGEPYSVVQWNGYGLRASGIAWPEF